MLSEQFLRRLSKRGVQRDDGQDYIVPARDIVEYNRALRAAADQLEAVREWAELSDREPRWDDLDAILTPDTTPGA